MTGKMASFLTWFFILLTYNLAAFGEEADPSLLFKKIDQAYFERDRGESLMSGERFCEEALKRGLPKDEAFWRMARFKSWEGAIAKESSEKLKLFKEAEGWAHKGTEANPENVEAHFWLGVAYGRIGETQGILKSLSLIGPIRHEMDEVLRLNPDHAGAHHLLGVMYRKLPWFKGGSHKKSIEELQKSISLNYGNTLYHLDLAKTYLEMNKTDEARQELEKVRTIALPFDPVEAEIDKQMADQLLDKR
jgi:tetratricopeptide (TPR) repeat protein